MFFVFLCPPLTGLGHLSRRSPDGSSSVVAPWASQAPSLRTCASGTGGGMAVPGVGWASCRGGEWRAWRGRRSSTYETKKGGIRAQLGPLLTYRFPYPRVGVFRCFTRRGQVVPDSYPSSPETGALRFGYCFGPATALLGPATAFDDPSGAAILRSRRDSYCSVIDFSMSPSSSLATLHRFRRPLPSFRRCWMRSSMRMPVAVSRLFSSPSITRSARLKS